MHFINLRRIFNIPFLRGIYPLPCISTQCCQFAVPYNTVWQMVTENFQLVCYLVLANRCCQLTVTRSNVLASGCYQLAVL